MFNLTWTPHSSLEKDNSLKHSCGSPRIGCLEYIYNLQIVLILQDMLLAATLIQDAAASRNMNFKTDERSIRLVEYNDVHTLINALCK